MLRLELGGRELEENESVQEGAEETAPGKRTSGALPASGRTHTAWGVLS